MIVYRNHQAGTKPDDKKYVYTDSKGDTVKDAKFLEQIKKMTIPPAYTKVKIDLDDCAKIIYEGYDDKNRLQQIYSKSHNTQAKKAKFCRLIEFGKVMPKLKRDIKKNLGSKRITQNKIIALILKIIWICGFRLGNQKYMILYESYGISNLRKSHMTFKGDNIYIEFKGKKSVINKCCITDKELVTELKNLISEKQPKDHIFTYSKNREKVLIKPTEINYFLKTYGNITSKDLRTFDVNTLFIDYIKGNMKELMEVTSVAKRKKMAKQALELTSSHINNTPQICKSSYLLTDIYALVIEEPKKFKKHFGGKVESRIQFINFLDTVYCKK
jgi:DNA topoisomerase-1